MMKSHLLQALHNEKFLEEFERLMPDDYFDWKITVVFYIAVHYIDAYFSSHGTPTGSHEIRKDLMKNHLYPPPQKVCDNYENLYRLARTARYNGFNDVKEFRKHQKEKLKEAKRNLKAVRDFINDDMEEAGEEMPSL